jgi:glycosyltransferase involved in cell wall biosynthesis
MKYALTIAFATYNSSSYLDNFYKSIFEQNIKNFEIIVVDDGSTDKSHEISLKWAKKYRNITAIRQNNSGLSVARNNGISHASGDWVVMPDPDDQLYPNLYKYLLSMAISNKLDIGVINGLHLFENKDPKPILNKKIPENKIILGEDFLKYGLNSGSFLHTTWLNIYNLNFLKKTRVNFIPDLLHQDILYTTEILFHARRVMYSNRILYGYTHRAGSATRQENSDAKNIKSIKNYCKILLLLDKFNNKNKKKFKNYETFKSQIPNEFSNIKRSLNRINDKKNLNLIIKYLQRKKIFGLVLRNSKFSLSLFKNLFLMLKYKILFNS